MTKQTYRLPQSKRDEVSAMLGVGVSSTTGPTLKGWDEQWFECVAEDATTAAKLEALGGVRV